ncbi:MAG: hypothetical protein M3Z08_04350 [Chloroflexota bacterium]|nr:hypothetical protein [Chloroflexota bacterium]
MKVAFLDNPRLQPLLDGSIRPEGSEFEWQPGHLAALFRQHLTEIYLGREYQT